MTLWHHTVVCEKVTDHDSFSDQPAAYRIILFDRDEDTGHNSVVDIIEAMDISFLSTFFSGFINDPQRTFEIGEIHKDVNLGRAVKMETKIRKVLESL